MEVLKSENIILFLFFFVPGFLSSKIWSLIINTKEKKTTDYILDFISYSIYNFFINLLFYYLIKIFICDKTILLIILSMSYFFIFPIILPILLKYILRIPIIKDNVILPTKNAWDYFFEKREPCFILVHLKNGKKIGGLFYYNSYAGSGIDRFDIYIEEVWKILKTGKFIRPIKDSKGMLITRENIDYLEFFEGKFED